MIWGFLTLVQDIPSDAFSTFDPKPAYMEFIYTLLDVEKIKSAGLKVKYDALYSTSCGYLDEVLQRFKVGKS
jgi:phosphoglucomutase